MAQRNRTALKAFFETGDVPDEGEFSDLIDSTLNIIDDGILLGGEDNITAHAGGGQADAYQLTKKNNAINTVGNVGDSVKLPAGVVGSIIYVFNNDSLVCHVFPSSGGFIRGQAVDTHITLGATKAATLFCYATGKWGIVL